MSQKVRLGDYISIKGGGTPNKAIEGYWNGNIPWMSVKDLKSTVVKTTINTITPTGLANSAANLITKGSLIIATRMAVGKVVYAGMDTAINQDLKAITVSSGLYHKYLFYQLNSMQDYFERNSKGATVKGIKLDVLRDLEIPLPPLEEQKKIAAILDAADDYRQKTKALIHKYDELTQSLFLDMFGDPVTNPMGWEFNRLDKVSFLTTKGSSPNWQGFEYMSEGVRFVTSENVRLGHLDLLKDKFVAFEFHDKLLRSQLKENDLLVNLVGASIGRGALVTPSVLPANINQAVAKTELDLSKVNPLFVLYQVITPQVQERLIGNKVEGARANISLKNVRELDLYIPPLSLQNQFAERVAQIQQQKQQAESSLVKAEELFSSLLQRAFKGELTS